MAHEQEPIAPTTLAKLIDETTYMPGKQKPPCCPPAIDPVLQLKWGLMLLGEEKATEYLQWLRSRLDNHDE
jgi:hypothetical protein